MIRSKLREKNARCIAFFKDKYIHNHDQSLRTGIENKTFDDGSIYYGQFDGSHRAGKGILTYKNGD